MAEDDIVEGKKELSALIDSRLMAKIRERELDWGGCPFDDIIEGLLIQGFAYEEVRFYDGYVRLSSVMALVRDFASKIEREVVDADKFLEAVGVGNLAEEGI